MRSRHTSPIAIAIAMATALAACAYAPPNGSDATVGFKVGDRVVLTQDSDLRVGKQSPIPSRFRYSRIFEFDRPLNSFPSRPFCDVVLSSDDPLIQAGAEFRITDNYSRASLEHGKLGNDYHISAVTLHAARAHPRSTASVFCSPESVLKLNLAGGADTNGRMMKTPEVQSIVKALLEFPDAR